MDSGQHPPSPPERLRPTLQLKIKANSWNGFRPTPLERLRPTLQLKIKANSWNKGSAENWHELTWRRLFSFQLILVVKFSIMQNPEYKEKIGTMVTKPIYRHLFVFVTKRVLNNDPPHEPVDNLKWVIRSKKPKKQ